MVLPDTRWIRVVLKFVPNASVERVTSPENPARLPRLILACVAMPGATDKAVIFALSRKSGTVAGAAVTLVVKLVDWKNPVPEPSTSII
jgi:hypothetical protein